MGRHQTESVSARVRPELAQRITRAANEGDYPSESHLVRDLLEDGFTGGRVKGKFSALASRDPMVLAELIDEIESTLENSELDSLADYFKEVIKESVSEDEYIFRWLPIDELEGEEKRAVLSVKENVATDEEFRLFLNVVERQLTAED